MAAQNGHMVSLENLSYLKPEFQDAFCTLATGGGYAGRKLYTDSDEHVADIKKPVILNGIAVVVTAQDLGDRTIHVNLPSIIGRLTEYELNTSFNNDKSEIMGGLLDLFVRVLERLPIIKISPERRPRMADFALLGAAVYEVMGKTTEDFLFDYQEMRKASVHRSIESSPVAAALWEFMCNRQCDYASTVKTLFDCLSINKSDYEGWPRSAKGFGDQLRRCAPGLRLLGIDVKIEEKHRRDGYHCTVRITPTFSENRPNDVRHVHEVHQFPDGREHGEHGERDSEELRDGEGNDHLFDTLIE